MYRCASGSIYRLSVSREGETCVQNYSTKNFLGLGFSRFSASLFLAATLAVVAGCGSGGAGNGSSGGAATPADTTPPEATGASIQLLASSPQMPSAGGDTNTVDLTAVVLSTDKQAVSGRAVTFSSATDSSAFINNISGGGVSDANGLVTAKLNLGTNKANRTIVVSAKADSATAANGVDVTGTTLTISGNSSLALNATTTLTFTVKDSAQIPLPGITVTVASQAGNAVAPATGVTNNSGQITAVVTGSVAGNDTITATAAGASAIQALTISGANFAFTAPALVAPATSIDIPLNVPTPVSVNWKDAAGVPISGQLVDFATSRGTITASATTNAAGDTPAGVTVSSNTAGAAIISASGPSNTPAATLNVAFVATTASSVTVQAVPSTIQVTSGSASQATNSSTISVLVRDADNNLVKNAGVNFSITSDPSGGSLTAARAVTDVTGSASVTYKAGGTSSPSNGVVIRATVTDVNGDASIAALPAPVVSTASLTVAGQSLLVRLGADNLVVSNSPVPTYSKTYVAIVTDAAQNPVAGTTVRFSLRPGRFEKGYYVAPVPPGTFWTKAATPTTCPNEDLNFNGNVDPFEDTNTNGQLDPGGSAIVNATAVTDANGVANAIVTYPKDHATWAEMILEARTGVVGNDPPALVTFTLPGLAADYNVAAVPPPGQTSPYGAGVAPDNVCTNTN